MCIGHLYYFLDVTRTLSISQSAKNLYISPQGLSQAIKSLEKENNLKFFVRTNNGLVLTSEGEKFCACAKEFLHSYEMFKEKSHRICSTEEEKMGGGLSIYTTPLFSASGIIFNILNILSENSPNSDFSISEHQPFDAIEGLLQDQSSSIALVQIPNYEFQELTIPEELAYDNLLEIGLVATVCANSVHAKKKFFTKQELVDLPLSCYSEQLIKECIHFMLGEYGKPNIVICSRDGRLSGKVALSQDIVQLGVNLTNTQPNDRVIIPIHDTLKLTVFVLYRNSQKETPIIKTVKSLIKSYFSKGFQHLAMSK